MALGKTPSITQVTTRRILALREISTVQGFESIQRISQVGFHASALAQITLLGVKCA